MQDKCLAQVGYLNLSSTIRVKKYWYYWVYYV